MFIIRSEQMDVFRESALRRFEGEMLVHLREFSPPLFKAAGEKQMHKAVRYGIGAASAYGFTFRGPIRLYLELMLLFGSRFDTDPQYPWAAEILTGQSLALQMQRADMLYEKTLDYRQKVAGSEEVYAIDAFKLISNRTGLPVTIHLEDLASGMLQEIKHIYPQKADYVGDEGIKALILEGIEEAHRHGFLTVRAIGIVVLLMLTLGHGCTDDPLYPWIARTLNNRSLTNPENKASRLEKRALTWLDHVLAYFQKGAQK
jgi:hypothetical protein